MKREAINDSEAGMNEESLKPFIDDMLECRKEALEKINKQFGTNIKVRFASSWVRREKIVSDETEDQQEQQDQNEESNQQSKETKPEDEKGDNE